MCELSEILGLRTPEIVGLKLMEYGDFTRTSISLLSGKAETKNYGQSPRLLRFNSTANEAWKDKIEWYGKNNLFKDLHGIDGRKTEFVWRIFPRSAMLGILEEMQKCMKST